MYNPNNNPERNPISFTEDMIDEWVIKTGKPRALLEEMLKIHTDYIKYLMNEKEDAINIKLPLVGTLRLNFFMVNRFLKSHPNHEVMKAKQQKLLECISLYGWDFVNFNRLMISKQYYKITGKPYHSIFKRFYLIFKTVEEVNNEQFNKKYRGGNQKSA